MLLRMLERDTGSLIIHDSEEEGNPIRRDATLTSTISFNEEVVFGVESADVSLDEDSYQVTDPDSYRESEVVDQHVPLNFRISDEV